MITHKTDGNYSSIYYDGEHVAAFDSNEMNVRFTKKWIDSTLLHLVSSYIQNNLI